MKKIVLATDFSERSDRALRRAILLAGQFEAALTVVHVVDDDRSRRIVELEEAAARDLLGELRSTLRTVDRVACETRVVLDDPFAGIARAVAEETPDLLVLGPHRRQLLRDVFVGTTAERSIRSVGCPVLMVNGPPMGAYRRVMLTSDLSEGSERTMRIAVALDLARGAELSVLHAFDAPATHLLMSQAMTRRQMEAYVEDRRAQATDELSEFAERAGLGTIRRDLRLEEGSTAETILTAAREIHADLLVVGTRRRDGLPRLLLGSVAEAVLRRAACDVLAIPPAAER